MEVVENKRLIDVISFLKKERVIYNDSDFAKQIEIGKSFLSDIKAGRKSMSEQLVLKICNLEPRINRTWLLTGEGEMLAHESTTPQLLPKTSYTSGRPYYNVDFIGGFDLVLNDQTILPEYNIDFAPYNQDGVVWCNITGNSMQPKISHGDIIAIKEVVGWQDYLSMGEIYAVVTANHLRTVKIIRQGKSEGTLRFIPINTAEFDEQEVPIKMITRVFEVLGCMKRL